MSLDPFLMEDDPVKCHIHTQNRCQWGVEAAAYPRGWARVREHGDPGKAITTPPAVMTVAVAVSVTIVVMMTIVSPLITSMKLPLPSTSGCPVK